MSTRAERAKLRSENMTLVKVPSGCPEVVDDPRGLAGMQLAARLSEECWALSGGRVQPVDRELIRVRFVPDAALR